METVPIVGITKVPDVSTTSFPTVIPSVASFPILKMPELIIFRPMEAIFKDSQAYEKDMEVYCKFKIGWHGGKTSHVSYNGENPSWDDVIIVQRKHNEEFAKVKVKDKTKNVLNNRIGIAKIDLNEVVDKGRLEKWYMIRKDDQTIGEILIQSEYASPNEQ